MRLSSSRAGLCAWLCALMAAAGAHAAEQRSGEYRYDIAPPPAFVVAAEVPEQWPQALGRAAEQGESWRNWLIDDQVDWRGTPGSHYRDTAVQPLSTETLSQAAQLRVDFDPSWQALSLHRLAVRRDGEWLDRLEPASITLARREQNFESSLYDGQVTALIVIKDVRIGDVVRLSYTLTGSHPVVGTFGLLGFSFGAADAVALRQVRLLAPASPGLTLSMIGGEVPAQQRTDESDVILTAVQRDLTAIHYADQAPSWAAQVPTLFVASKRSWADVAKWALTLYPPEPLSAGMEAALTRIRAAAPGPLERARAALNLTQDDIRYFGMEFGASTHQPAPPGVVLERRYGDCKDKSRLLVSLLTALDIPAVPALVDTDYQRQLDRIPPAAGAFDHVIVMATIEGRQYWLDPTQTQQRGPLDDLGFPDFERALLVAPGTTGLTTIQAPRTPRDALEVSETVRSLDGEAAELTIVSVWHGALAEYVRREAAGNGHQTMAEGYRQFYSRTYGEATTTAPLKIEDAVDRNTLTVTETYRIENFFRRDGDAGLIDFYAQGVGQFVGLPSRMDRRVPLTLRYPLKASHQIHIELPATARGYPRDAFEQTVADPAWDFRLSGSGDERQFDLRYDFSTRDKVVETASVREHLKHRRALLDELSRRINFRWQPPLAGERQERLRALLDELTADTLPDAANAH